MDDRRTFIYRVAEALFVKRFTAVDDDGNSEEWFTVAANCANDCIWAAVTLADELEKAAADTGAL